MRRAALKFALMPAVSAALIVSACGQKGPLYLPEKGGQVVTTSATAATPGQAAPRQPSPTPQAQSAPEQTLVTPALPAQTKAPSQAQPPAQAQTQTQSPAAQPPPVTPAARKKGDSDNDSQAPQ